MGLADVLERFLPLCLSEWLQPGPQQMGDAGKVGRGSMELIEFVITQWNSDGSLASGELKRQLADLAFVAPVTADATPPGPAVHGGEERKEAGGKSEESREMTELLRPRDLFDPRHPILHGAFLGTASFPRPFTTSSSSSSSAVSETDSPLNTQYLDFLVELGLKSTLTADIVLESCAQLDASFLALAVDEEETGEDSADAEEKKSESERVFQVAAKLTEHVWDSYTSLSSPRFWRKLASLRCVPVLVQGRRRLRRYSESVAWLDRHLAWTQLPVLREAHTPPVQCFPRLMIQSPPAVPAFLAHLACLTAVPLSQWQSTFHVDAVGFVLGSTTSVFIDCFQALAKCWDSLTRQQRLELQAMPLIPAGSNLIKASRLYFRLDRDLSPFM